MKYSVSALVLFALVLSASAGKIKLSDYTKVCSLSQPDFEECVRSSTQTFISVMSKGVREIGVAPIDPLIVPWIQLDQNDGPVGGFKLNLTDSIHSGLSDTIVKSVSADATGKRFVLDLFVPRYNVYGQYSAGGRILLLPVIGEGVCNVTGIDLGMKLVLTTKPIAKDDQTYCHIDKFGLKLTSISSAIFEFNGLFGGNKQLEDAINKFLTDNSVRVFHQLRPDGGQIIGELIAGLISPIFENVPCNQLIVP